MFSETECTVSLLAPAGGGVASNPVSAEAVAKIMSHWAVVADKLNEQLPLGERQGFRWKISISTGFADEKPREAYAHGEVRVIEYGRLGGYIVKAHCPNVLFNQAGCFLKGNHVATTEEVAEYILQSFKGREDE